MYSRREIQAEVLAPLAVILLISCVQSARPPHRTVGEYSQAIDNDPTVQTVQVSTLTNPNDNNPVLDYSFRTVNGVNIPVRVRALIRPVHINNVKRSGKGYNTEAERNCNAMGKNLNAPNGNVDQCGHLIAYILKGPGDWYNIVPQTRRLNVGTADGIPENDMIAPSVWATAERGIRYHVQKGGSVLFTVTVAYDLATSLRPTGFGTSESFRDASGREIKSIPSFWYSNDPTGYPEVWLYS